MRPAPARDRLHAAIVALALCSTSVSLVVAGQPGDPQSGQGPSATVAAQSVDPSADAGSTGSEATTAMRSFTDMIAEAAREQERLAAALPSQAQDCVDAVDASLPAPVSGSIGPDGSRPRHCEGAHVAGAPTDGLPLQHATAQHPPVDTCGDTEVAAAL